MQQINFMSSTIDDFSNFFKPDKDKNLFSIQEAIKDTLSLLHSVLHTKKINIMLDGDDFKVIGFVNEFKQVILNIVYNAKDAIVEHSKAKDKNGNIGFIKIHTKLDEKFNFIIIEDSGGGIKDTLIDRIFEPYFTTKEQGKGTGVGLYMSKSIIEEHMNGTITVANINSGVRFIISLPIIN
jgi:signal transduction histidine kinase